LIPSTAIPAEIQRLQTSMEQLHEKIQWAKAALMEWRDVMQRGEETNSLIEKYCKMDASKAEAMDSRRRCMQTAITKQRAVLISTYEEQKSLEQILERTSQLYRQAHLERRQLVETWKEAVGQMNQRERHIEETEKELDQARQRTAQKREVLKQHTDQLAAQELANREEEFAIGELNATASKLREQFAIHNDAVLLKTTEATTQHKALQGLAEQLNQQRLRNRRASAEEQDRGRRVEEGLAELQRMSDKAEGYRAKNLSAQDRLKQLEEIIGAEERNIKVLEDELSRLSGALFRSQQQLTQLQDQEKLLAIEAAGFETNIAKLKAGRKGEERELARQSEMVYNVDLSIQQMEARVANMKGLSRDADQQHELEEKVDRLEKVVARKRHALKILEAQVAKVDADMRKTSNTFNGDKLELDRLEGKLKERKLYIEGSEKTVAKATQANHEKLVERSLLEMRIKQLEKHIAKQDDRLYTLERHKIELDAEMNGRLLDIKAHLGMLGVRRKQLLEERAQLRADIAERGLKIEQLKKRYDVALELLGQNEDGSVVTGTQIKVQAAQEKFLLLREGNDLNDKVIKAEEAVKAMENTLRLMNYSNESYRRSLSNAEENVDELAELAALQTDYSQACQKLKQARHSLTVRSQNLEELSDQRETAEDLAEQMERMRLDSNEVLMKVHKELTEQKTKMARAERELKLVKKSARQKVDDSEYMAAFEADLAVKEQEERNTSALQQLADLVEANEEMEAIVSKHLVEKGISIPTQYGRTRSQISWRSEVSEATGKSRGEEYSVDFWEIVAQSNNSRELEKACFSF
jgi:coiled-coil domain-containing protein 39